MSTITLDDTETETETTTRKAFHPRWKVFYHNDPITTFEFVIVTLIEFFHKTPQEAINLAMEVDKTGVGLAGVYAMELAELKQEQVHSKARTAGFPLTVTIEPDE